MEYLQKFEEYEHDLSQVSSNESSDANLSIKLARLEDRVMKLIEFVSTLIKIFENLFN